MINLTISNFFTIHRNTCVGRREALEVCEEISQSVHRDPTLYDLYEQYCPRTKRISADAYAGQICAKYRVKYPSLLSGSGRQLLGKNSGCIVACEDRVWKDIHYQMDAFEDGKFPFGTDCSEPNATISAPGYCLNGKCIRFGRGVAHENLISYDTAESVLYRSEILQLFAPDTSLTGAASGSISASLSLPPVSGLAGSASTHGDSNSLLYSTISNELYKRATSHQSSSGPALQSSQSSPSLPNQFNLNGGAPVAAPLSSDDGQSSLTFATPRRRPSEVESSGSRLQIRRIKRSALNFGAARHFRTMKRQQDEHSAHSPPTNVFFRKAGVQEALDPEADYVSWTLVRSHRRAPLPPRQSSASVTSYHSHHPYSGGSNWTPVMPKKPLRPIKLSHFTLTAKRVATNKRKNTPSGQQASQPAEHLQTFTLVKHDKRRLVNHIRTWHQHLSSLNHIAAMPLANETHFLDDDEDEEEEAENKNNAPVETPKRHEEKEMKTEAPPSERVKGKSKIRKHFSLGHESWPPHNSPVNLSTEDDDVNDGDEEEGTRRSEQPKTLPRRGQKAKEGRIELRVEPYVWSVILSECSRTCGQGIRSVRVVCTVGQKTVDEGLCDGGQKPMHKRVEPCKERDCIGR